MARKLANSGKRNERTNQKCIQPKIFYDYSARRESQRERGRGGEAERGQLTWAQRCSQTLHKTESWKQYFFLYYRVFIILSKLFVITILAVSYLFSVVLQIFIVKVVCWLQFRLRDLRGAHGGRQSERLVSRSWVGIVWAASFWNVTVSIWASSRLDCVCVCLRRYVRVSVCVSVSVFYLCLPRCECACAFCTCVHTLVCVRVCRWARLLLRLCVIMRQPARS